MTGPEEDTQDNSYTDANETYEDRVDEALTSVGGDEDGD